MDTGGVQKAAALEDFVHERLLVGVPIAHAFEDFDFVVESLAHGRCQVRADVGLDIEPVLPDRAHEVLQWLETRFLHEPIPELKCLSELFDVLLVEHGVEVFDQEHRGVDVLVHIPEPFGPLLIVFGEILFSLHQDKSS